MSPESNKKETLSNLIFLAVGLGGLGLLFLITFSKHDNGEFLKPTKSLLEQQSEIDKKISAAGFSFESPQIIVDPYGISPLSAIVSFSTETEITPEIIIEGEGDVSDVILDYPTGTIHRLEVFGLHEGANTVHLFSELGAVDLTIVTEPLDLAVSCRDPWVIQTEIDWTHPYVCDEAGNIRWLLNRDSRGDIVQTSDGMLLGSTERRLLYDDTASGLYYFDYVGKVHEEVNVPGGYYNGIALLPDGKLAVGGNNPSYRVTRHDYILILKDDGSIENEIKLDDLLPEKKRWLKYFSTVDWFKHCGLKYNPKDSLLYACGDNAESVVALSESGKLIWVTGTYSDYEDYGLHDKDGNTNYFANLRMFNSTGDLTYYHYDEEGNYYYSDVTIDSAKRSFEKVDVEHAVETPLRFVGINLDTSEAKIIGAKPHSEVAEKSEAISSSVDIDDDYRSRNIEISLESDCIAIKGEFKEGGLSKFDKGDEAKLILSQDYKTYYYDLLSENDTNYIYPNNLSGVYEIFIELDGKVYKTNKKISL